MFSFDKMEHYYDLIIYNIWKRFNFYDESQILLFSSFEIQDLDLRFKLLSTYNMKIGILSNFIRAK